MKPNEIAKKHLDVTGFVEPDTGYYWEMEDAIVEACAVPEMYIESESLPNEIQKLIQQNIDDLLL